MPLTAGTRLGPYEVASVIGAGRNSQPVRQIGSSPTQRPTICCRRGEEKALSVRGTIFDAAQKGKPNRRILTNGNRSLVYCIEFGIPANWHLY
jgi:hypothetical protein